MAIPFASRMTNLVLPTIRQVRPGLATSSPLFVANANIVHFNCRYNSTATATTTTTSKDADPVDLSSLPTPPGPSKWESVRAVLSGEFTQVPYAQKLYREHGNVVRLWAFQEMYNIFDPEIFMGILRQEWALPYGAAPNMWPFQVYYKQKCADTMPLMLLQGEEWKTPRHAMQTHMFSPKAADSYQPGINQVVKDASSYLKYNPKPDLNEFLMNVSFEMLAQVLLDRRMGLLRTDQNDKSMTDEKQFVESAVVAFHALGELLLTPDIIKSPTILRFFPVWNKLETSMDRVWDIGMKWLEQAEQEQSEVAFFTKLEAQGQMDRQERLVNLVTFLQAGVDTTSNSLAWAVLELARRPKVQERLRQELNETIDEGVDYHRQYKLPYLKAFMREVQRRSPAAVGNMRKLPYDVQAGDYVLQKDSLILWNQDVYATDPDLLGGDPNEFIPDRWLAYDQVENVKELNPRQPIAVDGFDVLAPAPILSHPLMTTAFGVGPRMCVGSRVAQNEMHSFLSQIVRDYEFEMDPPEQEIQRVAKLLQVPDPFPQIRFHPYSK
ncbi:cytochrome P450 [Nitzschia inconspicua]|uniref:Cytochrome P450 n=1 Tax=Nitzschia inconspicua TaxID=303405 RepID=A0A9K3PZX6_9STRA|nr:cytochrome P450 [Nitzschia inconspicua]